MRARFLLLLALTVSPATAQIAAPIGCTGTGRDYICIDEDGMRHHVRRLGPVSQTDSRGPGGATTSRSFQSGAVTRTEGRDAEGGRWEWTTRSIGDTTITTGRDPQGRSFQYRCDKFRCY